MDPGMEPVTLYGNPGWGSVLVESQLVLYGLEYQFETVGHLFRDAAAREALARINPAGQIPVIRLADGTVMTESAAITLWLAERTGSDMLVPTGDADDRARFLRWLLFINTSIYPVYTYADDPGRFVPDADAREGFLLSVRDHAKRLYRILEDNAEEPWFLGDRFSAIDIYLAAMMRWPPPSRKWREANTPKLTAAARACQSLPRTAELWRRNLAHA